MAHVEIRKSGRVVSRREVDDRTAREGFRLRLGEQDLWLALGDSTQVGEYEVRVVDSPSPQSKAQEGPAGAPDPAASSEGPKGGPYPMVEGYQITGRLGEGGMGTVWKAVQLSTRRDVALKFLSERRFASRKANARFEREVELSARLEHPSIARVYDSGLARGAYYYALEYIEGPSLDRHVEENKLPQRQVLELMRKICRAVQYAHQRGVIHRDLKPSNILVTKDGEPHVLDFGLAKTLLEEGEADPHVTISVEGELAGTPEYMSPEQAAGRHSETDTRSDVYALGVILYRLLTGKSPHDLSGTRYELLRRIVEEEVRRPREASPAIDEEMEALLLKALSLKADDRYAGAGELGEDIGNYLSGEPLTARPATAVYFLRKRLRKHRVPVAIGAAGVLTLVGVAVLAYVGVSAARDQAVAAEQKAREEKGLGDRRLYVSEMMLAQQAWEQTDIPHLLEILERQHPRNTGGTDHRRFEWHYWWRRSHRELLTLKQIPGPPLSVCFSPDGKRLASVDGGWVEVWNAESGQTLYGFKEHRGPVLSVCFSPDGTRLASGSSDRTVKVWDAASGKELLTLTGHGDGVNSVRFSPDGRRLASGGKDTTLKVWDPEKGQELLTLKGHGGEVQSVCFSPDGRRLASGSLDGTVKVWDAASGREILTLNGHGAPVHSVCFGPDANRLASGGSDSTVKVWDPASGRELLTLKGHGGEVQSVSFSPDGKRLASGGSDKTVKVWDAETGRELLTLKGHGGGVQSVCFSPDGKRLASGGSDKTVKVWDAERGQEPLMLKGEGSSAYSVCFSPDGRRLASGGQDTTVQVWDAESGQQYLTLKGHFAPVRSVCFSPDGKRVASGSVDNTVKVWDAETGQDLFTLSGHAGPVQSVCFSPDGKRLASGSLDHTVKVWDASGSQQIVALKSEGMPVISVCFSPDGRRLASCSGAGDYWIVRVRDPGMGQQILGLRGGLSNVCFSPDGKRLASGSEARFPGSVNNTVKVWDAASGRELLTLRGHGGHVLGVCFSPDGRRLASGSLDSTVKVWDAASGQELLTLKGHGGPVLGVCFSPDGTRLASCNGDTVTVW